MDLSQSTLKISDLRKQISLELIQHEQVKVYFEESSEDGQISAELFAPDCTSGSLCPRLYHNAFHTGDHTHLSIFVHQGQSSWFPLFIYWLVPILLLSLLVVLYRSWAKQKLSAPDLKGDQPSLQDVSNSCSTITDMFTARDVIKANTDESLLPPKDLVNTIMLSAMPLQDQVNILLGQVKLAKTKKRNDWLAKVASDAQALQFHDASWICSNIFKMNMPKKAPSTMSAGPSKDIRLLDNPDLERVTSDEGQKGAAMEIDSLTSEIDAVLGTIALEDKGARPKEIRKISTSPVRRSPRNLSPLKPMTSTSEGEREKGPRKEPECRPKGITKGSRKEPQQDSRKESKDKRSYRGHHAHEKERGRQAHRDDHYRHYGGRKDDHAGRRPYHDHGKRKAEKDRHTERRDSFASPVSKRPRYEERTHKARIDTGVCPIPGCLEKVSRVHAFNAHVPGILDEKRGLSQEVTRSRVNLLIKCSSRIVGCLDVEILAKYIKNLDMLTDGCAVLSKCMKSSLDSLCEEMGYDKKDSYSIGQMNSPALLMHWRVFLVVLGVLDKQTRGDRRAEYPAFVPPLSQRPHAVDSHFHLDRVRNKLTRRCSFEEMLKVEEPNAGDEVYVVGGVAVYCDPATYPSQEEVTHLSSQGIGMAIGLHPKTKEVTDEAWKNFEECLQFNGVCALGEVGLDHFRIDPALWDHQHVVLDRALSHLTPDKVLVLHNRGDGNDMLQLLYHLKGPVPKKQKIHLHCYSGSASARDRWVSEFPNIHFGFTGLVADFNATQKQALKTLEPHRLLLETDAPYFSFGRQVSTPALLGTTARLVAAIRGDRWEDVLEISSKNAQRLYQLRTSEHCTSSP